MSARVVSREPQAAEIAAFLTSVVAAPCALVIEGEPGIGKTTLWLETIERAEADGFRVMAARPVDAESVLAYTSLADMLDGVDTAILAELPEPQRLALDRVLLRGDGADSPADQRAVAAGFLSVVMILAERTPVLVAVDDLQWLDSSSRLVIAFVARRLARTDRRARHSAYRRQRQRGPLVTASAPRFGAADHRAADECRRAARGDLGPTEAFVFEADDVAHRRGLPRQSVLCPGTCQGDERPRVQHRLVPARQSPGLGPREDQRRGR